MGVRKISKKINAFDKESLSISSSSAIQPSMRFKLKIDLDSWVIWIEDLLFHKTIISKSLENVHYICFELKYSRWLVVLYSADRWNIVAIWRNTIADKPIMVDTTGP